MADFFHCHSCHKVAPLIGTSEKKCPLCGGSNGDIRTGQHTKEMVDAEAIWNIDLITGKPAKKKR